MYSLILGDNMNVLSLSTNKVETKGHFLSRADFCTISTWARAHMEIL